MEEEAERNEEEDSSVEDSTAMGSDSDGESNASRHPAVRLDATDWPGPTEPSAVMLSDRPLLATIKLIQCSCFHARTYSGDVEFGVTAMWTGMAGLDALYTDVDFAGEKEVVAERSLQAEAALSRSLQLDDGPGL